MECIIYKEQIQVTQDIDEEEYICGLADLDYFNNNKNIRRDRDGTDTDTDTDSKNSGISLHLVPIEYESQ